MDRMLKGGRFKLDNDRRFIQIGDLTRFETTQMKKQMKLILKK